MNESLFLSDDPKLTAYALDELEGSERLAVEAALREDPEAQQRVEEIRALAKQLATAFEAELAPVPAMNLAAADPYRRMGHRSMWRFPHLYYAVGGLAAAAFAVVLAWQESPPRSAVPTHRYVAVQMPVTEAEAVESAPASSVRLPSDSAARGFERHPFSVAPGTTPAPRFEAAASGLLADAKKLTELPRYDDASSQSWPPAEVTFNYGNADQRTADAERAHQQRTQAPKLAGAAGRPWSRVSSQAKSVSTENPSGALLAVNEQPIALSAFRVEAEGRSSYLPRSIAAGIRAGGSGESIGQDSYAFRRESDFIRVADQPLSTFSADVDTASYANVRRMLLAGQRPPVDAVRIEEMLTYFPYAYAGPRTDAPFAATMEVADAPWMEGHRLVRIGLKAREVATAERSPANLVFLLDVSGSMNRPNRLPLVQESMRLLLGRLRGDDRVAIVTYAGASGLALPSTAVTNRAAILSALEELRAGGSTHGSRGIELAYEIAKANFVPGGINRVILCTDGDFNVGVTSEGGLVRLIQEKAKSGVFLTVLGFGMGNLKDAMMQQLADSGNGNYGYVDTRREAEKLLVEQVSGTLVTVAKDVKLQVEFNPAKVASYRLIGYEKRALNQQDFANDKVDAGELGAGHTVTALYEIVPANLAHASAAAETDENTTLRYGELAAAPSSSRSTRPELVNELLTLKVRYKEPAGTLSKKLEFALKDQASSFAAASPDFKFVSAVAAFGMLLKDSTHRGNANYAAVVSWAEAGIEGDAGGYRAEFVGLIRRAEALE